MRSALSLAADSVMHPARHACRAVQPTFVSFVKWVSRVGDFFSSKCTRVCESQKGETYLTGRCFLDRNRTLSWKKNTQWPVLNESLVRGARVVRSTLLFASGFFLGVNGARRSKIYLGVPAPRNAAARTLRKECHLIRRLLWQKK